MTPTNATLNPSCKQLVASFLRGSLMVEGCFKRKKKMRTFFVAGIPAGLFFGQRQIERETWTRERSLPAMILKPPRPHSLVLHRLLPPLQTQNPNHLSPPPTHLHPPWVIHRHTMPIEGPMWPYSLSFFSPLWVHCSLYSLLSPRCLSINPPPPFWQICMLLIVDHNNANREHRAWIRLPKSIEHVQQLGRVFSAYTASHYTTVLLSFCLSYIL